MDWGTITFYGALALGLIYEAAFCYRDKGLAGFLVKTGSTALLALWAYLAGGPVLLVLALAFSSLGDAFLAGKQARWLLPGMGAFFIAHAAYVPLFWGLAVDERTLPILAAQIILVLGGAGFVRWLAPWVEPGMRLPVIAYGALILVMGAAALALMPSWWIVTLGAMMFIASDVILSLQLFRKPADQPTSIPASLAVWALYFGGQVLIAWGVLQGIA